MLAIMTGSPNDAIRTSRTISVPHSNQIQVEAGITFRQFTADRPEHIPAEAGFAVRLNTPEMARFLSLMFERAAQVLEERAGTAS